MKSNSFAQRQTLNTRPPTSAEALARTASRLLRQKPSRVVEKDQPSS